MFRATGNHGPYLSMHCIICMAGEFLHTLQHHLVETHTPDTLHQYILHNISGWMRQQIGSTEASLWMRGCLPAAWIKTIDIHLRNSGLYSHKCTGIGWTKKLCTIIFMHSHRAWCIRSSMIDEASQTTHKRQQRQQLKAAVTELYNIRNQCILNYPFSVSLSRRLLFNNDHLSAWLSNHKANILQGHTKWKSQRRPTQLDIWTFFPVTRRTH